MARNAIKMPTATSIPPAVLAPTGEASPPAGDNAKADDDKLDPLPVYTAAELPAAWRMAIVEVGAVDETAVETRRMTKKQVKTATRNLMLLTAQMFRNDPAFTGEDVCLAVNGKAKVDGWNKRIKSQRFSEWNMVGKAARETARVNDELFAIANTKEKFCKACSLIVGNNAIPDATIAETFKPKKAGPVSDGQHFAIGIAALSAISDLNVVAALADIVDELIAFKTEQNALGNLLDDAQVAEREKAAKAGGTTTAPLTWREKVALAKAKVASATVQ